MYPDERSLVETYKNRPFAIVGVNSDDSPAILLQAKREQQLSWTSFFDGGGTEGPIATRWRVRSWPTVFVLDHEGVIRSTSRGDLDSVIARLVAAAEAR